MRNDLSDTPPVSIVVFPYLKTNGPVSIGSLTFRSTDDIGALDTDMATQVREVLAMLFLKDDRRVKSASYAVVPFIDFGKNSITCLEHLAHIQAVVAYAYAAPDSNSGRLFLSTEHSSLVIFSPWRVPVSLVSPDYHVVDVGSKLLTNNAALDVDGYMGLINFRHHFCVAPGSRLYGPIPHVTLNISQDLQELIFLAEQNPDLELLLKAIASRRTQTADRILSAVRWYNAANSEANDEMNAVVNMAIAFETMLGFPDNDKRTERLVDAISLLLGRIPRLDSWARQFYQARSEIVHEGRSERLRFITTDTRNNIGQLGHGSLLSYARQIFRLCVGTLLTGDMLADKAGLNDRLITNQERFESICRILAEKQGDDKEALRRITPIVAAIERYSFASDSEPKLETLLGAGRLVTLAFVRADPSMDHHLRSRVERISNAPRSPDHHEEIEALKAFHEDAVMSQLTDEPDSPQGAALRLLRTIWGHVLLHNYRLSQSRVEKDQSQS